MSIDETHVVNVTLILLSVSECSPSSPPFCITIYDAKVHGLPIHAEKKYLMIQQQHPPHAKWCLVNPGVAKTGAKKHRAIAYSHVHSCLSRLWWIVYANDCKRRKFDRSKRSASLAKWSYWLETKQSTNKCMCDHRRRMKILRRWGECTVFTQASSECHTTEQKRIEERG